MSRMSGVTVSQTWDPASILDGNEVVVTATVVPAALGDFALASFTTDVADLELSAQVTGVNTVTVSLSNNTGGTIDLASGTLRVKVVPFDAI